MLHHYNGVHTLGKVFLRPVKIEMFSFSGTSSLAADTMRSLGILWRPSSSIARASSQSPNRVWNPKNGIVFGNNALSHSSARLASMISSNSIEAAAGRHVDIEHSYVMTSSPQSEIPDSQASTNSVLSYDEEQDDTSYVPSPSNASLSKSQVLELPETTVEGLAGEEFTEENNNVAEKEIHIPLSFQIPPDVLEKAKTMPPGSLESYWSHKLYRGSKGQEVKVHYCKSKHTTERVAQYFVDDDILGFDIEWKSEATRNAGIKKNVALIQIASEERVALFHVALFSGDTVEALVSPTLKKIMEDQDVTKVGVAIKADCTRLRNFLQIDPKGILELSHLYKLVKYSTSGDIDKINKKLVSLATQVEEHLPLRIYKGEVRGSDWSQALSMDQILYAAADAYCNFVLYNSLEAKRKQLDPTPPRPYHAELNLPIRLATGAEIPTVDEAIEDPEAPVSVASKNSHPASALEAAAENVQIESEDDGDLNNAPAPRTKQRAPTKLKESKEAKYAKWPSVQPPKPPIMIVAEAWALNHRETHPAVKNTKVAPPTFAALRTYSLWYQNPTLSLSQIAAVLREPPLRLSTVANYILEVVRVEKVPFEEKRLLEVFAAWPEGSNAWRYKTLRDGMGLTL